MDDSLLYPYLIEPKLVSAIWGGDALVKRFGKAGDPAAKLGESWECWDTNDVTDGPLKGESIADLRTRLGPEFLGNLDPNRIFPVLTKIIDARDSLSVQVHPDDEYAQRVEHQPNGKTECWYVFDAKPGAELVLGWTRDTTREEYERRVEDGTLGDILRRVPVSPGQVFYLPAGTLHAIGAGIIVFETQQASDLTYRIFDWNRVDASGKPRELHVQKAADVLDYRASDAGAIETIEYELGGIRREACVADRNFTVEKIELTSAWAILPTEGRPLILMTLDRNAEVRCSAGSAELGAYQTVLFAADAHHVELRARQGAASMMFVTPPARADAMEERLQSAGIDGERIERFLHQFAPLINTSTCDS
ncbi:MAG: class I mannose-6-phosphate isomerase [Candidatus Eremiobacteraeota bacterium]|nr:class I mannose-6-phosphate isomerase [Candidatus Eremiobacteraeota bacterium]